MADKFEDLRTFVTVVETGGVNAAAARLGIAKSAMSRRLSDLEARLGTTLVERTTRRFDVTEAGRTLHREGRRLLDELAELEAGLSGRSRIDRPLVVYAERSLAAHLLAPALVRLHAARREIRIAISTEPAEVASADLVVTNDGASARLALGTYDRIVVAAPSYLASRDEPRSPADLDLHAGIAVISADGTDWRFATGTVTRPAIAVEVPDEDVALAVAVAGIGLAQLPDYMCRAALHAGSLIAVMRDHNAPGGRITVGRGDRVPPEADLLIDHLASELARRL